MRIIMRKGVLITVALGVAIAVTSWGVHSAMAASDAKKTVATEIQSLQELPTTLSSIKLPTVEDPAWLKQAKAARVQQQVAADSSVRTVTYDVATRGVITASFAGFKTDANQTLNDSRGWARMGVRFEEVASGGMFTLVLSQASQMTTFSATGCDTQYSCNVGRFVIINQDRWQGATPSWNNAGGSLRNYRHMVINHETGHWLGHGHAHCSGAGQPAAVMQQQSIDLEGCKFNPWPLASELWSTTLGISL